MTKEVVKLSEGSGGEEMDNLIKQLSKDFFRGNWKNCDKDGATFEDLVFTTDSYVVTPIFFPGGNIGKLAFCGTVNDLAVMGATPIGISLSLIIEEGFSKDELKIITDTIAKLSNETKIPVVTGDTKVVEKGKIDKIMITTSGIGKTKTILDKPLCENDAIIISGSLGDHAIALLSKRFDFETNIISDSKPLNLELKEVKTLIKQAKDITRGGLSAILNEICEKNKVSALIFEENIPIKEGVKRSVEFLGINLYDLACEGRFICVCDKENVKKVVTILKKFNEEASIIGHITDKTNGHDVVCQTKFGKKLIHKPTGNIVPRIC